MSDLLHPVSSTFRGPRTRRGRQARRLTLAVFSCLCACGPSFEAIQEGDLRFAHCDRLDLDPNIAPSHRLHCWREWRRVYTYGQTRDRVEYAQRRIAEVVSGDTEPSFVLPEGPAPTGAGPGEADTGASRSSSDRLRVARSVAELPAPSSAALPLNCRDRCGRELRSCETGCETQPTGCASCGPSHETCLRGCS